MNAVELNTKKTIPGYLQ